MSFMKSLFVVVDGITLGSGTSARTAVGELSEKPLLGRLLLKSSQTWQPGTFLMAVCSGKDSEAVIVKSAASRLFFFYNKLHVRVSLLPRRPTVVQSVFGRRVNNLVLSLESNLAC